MAEEALATGDAQTTAGDPTAPTQVPPAAAQEGDRAGAGDKPTRRRRRKARRRARRVRPADPGARADVAAAALADRPHPEPEPETDAEIAGAEPAGEGGSDTSTPSPLTPEMLASAAGPIFRVALKAVATFGLRKKWPKAAATLYGTAEAKGCALAQTLGVRVAELVGPTALVIAASVAEVAEPFLADLWDKPAGPAEIEVKQ